MSKAESGARFVIGNVGEGNPIDFFEGQIRAVRISKGERYSGNLTPDEAFVTDPADGRIRAVLIYDGNHVEGGKVIDMSGDGQVRHDGRVGRG